MGLFWFLCGGLLYLARANEMELQTSEKNGTATLEEEMDNQENVLTQLLGDYDKVKTLSEGSDCRCKCVVKPLSRSACARVEEGRAEPEDFYTVETVTAGPDCRKCVCVAPPSALNPCEGDFRFRKLQEAAKDDIKLSSIMDLLEGASYGMDLLKLHSVTTKLLERIEKIEQSFSVNQTKERWSLKEEKLQVKSPRLHQRQEKKKRLSIDAPLLQKNEAAAFAHKEKKYEEKFVGIQANKSVFKRVDHDDHEELQESIKAKEVPSNKTIRRMTFYKSNTIENKDGDVHTVHEVLSGDGSVDLIFEDQLHKQDVASPVPRPGVTAAVTQTPTFSSKSKNSYLTYSTTSPEGEILNRNTSNSPANITETIIPITSTSRVTTITPLRIPNTTLHTGKDPTKMSKLSWDEPTAQPKTQLPKKQGICKDTLASIAEPVTHNSYGKSAGSWMKDPKGNGKVIYVTDFYYGNTLLEFRDLDVFKQGQFSNFYKLPYNWLGTGHVVYSGSFFYNRAFSRDIIRFDLRLRYVAAWTTLHDAITQEEEEVPSDLERQSEIDFGVDESGLWVVYPALDEEGFHQEVIILSKLRPSDLQKEKIWRTGLRRHYYGNCFVICGVLYAVDSVERTYANISYAFDTHTHTQMIPRLPFINNYTYTTQIDYNPKERMLYSWDNGHQVTYNVIFAY